MPSHLIFPVEMSGPFSDSEEITFRLFSKAFTIFDKAETRELGNGVAVTLQPLEGGSEREGAKEGDLIIVEVKLNRDTWNEEDGKLMVATKFKDALFSRFENPFLGPDDPHGKKAKDSKDRFSRFDRGKFSKVTKTPQGYWKADGFATRVGIFTYRLPDGNARREYRPAEEVFKQDSLNSLKGIPVTNDHPESGMLTATNTKKFAVGFTGERVDQVDNFVAVGLTVTDAGAIKEIADLGKQELSCGYKCDLEFTPGEFKGSKYDAIQRDIVYNHLAIVDKGRAGPHARLKLDSLVAVMDYDKSNSQGGNITMTKVTIDGVEYEVSEAAAAAIVGKMKADKETVDVLTGERDGLKETLDAAKGRNDELEKQVKDHADSNSDEKFQAAVKARIALEQKVAPILGKDIKLDAMSVLDIKKAVIAKENPEAKLDEKSESYVDGRFDAVLEGTASRVDHNKNLADDISKAKQNGPKDKIDSAERAIKFAQDNQELWKKPIGVTKASVQAGHQTAATSGN